MQVCSDLPQDTLFQVVELFSDSTTRQSEFYRSNPDLTILSRPGKGSLGWRFELTTPSPIQVNLTPPPPPGNAYDSAEYNWNVRRDSLLRICDSTWLDTLRIDPINWPIPEALGSTIQQMIAANQADTLFLPLPQGYRAHAFSRTGTIGVASTDSRIWSTDSTDHLTKSLLSSSSLEYYPRHASMLPDTLLIPKSHMGTWTLTVSDPYGFQKRFAF